MHHQNKTHVAGWPYLYGLTWVPTVVIACGVHSSAWITWLWRKTQTWTKNIHKGGILLDGLRNIKHNHNHQESIIFCKSQNSTASERKYQCYVCQRTQGEHRDLPRKLRDLIKQEFSSTVVYFLDSGIRMHYDPEAIRSTNKVDNMWLSPYSQHNMWTI
jgi:hypothetical protein